MEKKIVLSACLLLSLGGSAFCADLIASEKRRLDREILEGRTRTYREATIPYFAAPPSYYRKKATTRTCIDDGDGVTCHFDTFTIR